MFLAKDSSPPLVDRAQPAAPESNSETSSTDPRRKFGAPNFLNNDLNSFSSFCAIFPLRPAGFKRVENPSARHKCGQACPFDIGIFDDDPILMIGLYENPMRSRDSTTGYQYRGPSLRSWADAQRSRSSLHSPHSPSRLRGSNASRLVPSSRVEVTSAPCCRRISRHFSFLNRTDGKVD